MEELKLRKITIHTEKLHELESFLVEVLGAETVSVDEYSFLAVVAGVTFDVRSGIAVKDAFEFEVTPGFLNDILSRWEFYSFRRGASISATASDDSLTCTDIDGREWAIYSRIVPRNEYPSISVRNC